ncbi:helix-turn-helix transcriptional regulator [Acinetobacter indicus]|uniref:helix-turn-helix transcriptional regulator n=1 Tax=Acinetobacter indicus TaxID=756892 RepID=UPI000CEC5402|nr:hypothetical protein [Acinetobacter indicus]
MSERLLQVQVENIEDMVPTNIVGTKFIAGETGLHIRQVQRLAKKGAIPKTRRFNNNSYGWLYSDVKDFIEANKTKPLNASNDPAF